MFYFPFFSKFIFVYNHLTLNTLNANLQLDIMRWFSHRRKTGGRHNCITYFTDGCGGGAHCHAHIRLLTFCVVAQSANRHILGSGDSRVGLWPANSNSGDVEHVYLRQGGYAIVVVSQFLSNFSQKRPNGFAWNFQERLAIEQTMVAIWITVSGYRDCFPDLSLLGDTESG